MAPRKHTRPRHQTNGLHRVIVRIPTGFQNWHSVSTCVPVRCLTSRRSAASGACCIEMTCRSTSLVGCSGCSAARRVPELLGITPTNAEPKDQRFELQGTKHHVRMHCPPFW